MEHVSVADLKTGVSDGGADQRELTATLSSSAVAINRYVVKPGERMGSLHAHLDQEEVFVVIEGTMTFEIWGPRGGSNRSSGELGGDEIAVEEGEAIRFGPGEFQSGKNNGDGVTGNEAVVLALGAPRESGRIRIPLECPECEHESRRPAVSEGGETPMLVCPSCGLETDATCPACGSDDMGAVLAEGRTTVIGVCGECGAESRA